MEDSKILELISRGRTDYIIELLNKLNWEALLEKGPIKALQWLVYYNDVTGLRAVLEKGGTLESINLDSELGNAAFFGHWKVCDFLINQGADVNCYVDKTQETPLHNAFVKAGRPYYFFVVKLLIEKGADVNAKTLPGIETGAFMRDVRTKGETPLHRAAAYADERTIQFLLDNGADKSAKDANGDSPLTWASEHLRPGKILVQLAYGEHQVSKGHGTKNTSDHGHGWGNSMDWNLIGDYVPEIPKNSISYQTATSLDIKSIATLHANSWQQNNRGILADDFLDNKVHSERLKVWTKRLNQPTDNQHIITAKENNVLVGFTCLFGGKHKKYGTYLDNLHIAKDWKGKGIGKKLMQLARQWTKENYPNQGLYLYVFVTNTPAIEFYEGIGGKRMETELHDLGDETGRMGEVYLYWWESL